MCVQHATISRKKCPCNVGATRYMHLNIWLAYIIDHGSSTTHTGRDCEVVDLTIYQPTLFPISQHKPIITNNIKVT